MFIDTRLGNCIDVMQVIDKTQIDAVITDPPYNIGFQGYNSYADNLPDDEYIEALSTFQQMPVAIIHYPEEMMRWVIPALGAPDYVSAWCYNSNISRRFRLINYYGLKPEYSRIKKSYKNPTDRRIKKLIDNGSVGTSLYEWWDDIQIVKNVSKEKSIHPCPVPIKLMERIILLTTNEGDTILDPFMGGGTTGLACIRTNRNFIGIEIDPKYLENANGRIKNEQILQGVNIGMD